MMLNIRHCLLLLCFFFVAALHGQDDTRSIELKTLLEEWEKEYNVRFSYIDSDVKDVKILPPGKLLPLKARLQYLESRAGLSYKEIGNNYYTLYRSTKSEDKICGYVLDQSDTPLENATISFAENQSVTSGPDGYFEMPRPLEGRITVTYLGFESKTITIHSFTSECKEITLNGNVQVLEELVTERYIATGISKPKDGTFVIKPRKFGILPGLIEPDALLTMQQLPGINSIDETVSNINVRGGTHDQNLFMWNGIRLFQTGHFFGLISALNPHPAYDIKIAKNGTSAFYGESVSSAIDISSRSEDIGTGTTSISTNMINADFYTRIKASEKTGFEISARRSFTDVIDLPAYSKYSKRIFQNTIVRDLDNSTDVNYKSDKEFYFYDFSAQYHQKIGNRSNLYINVLGIKNKLDFTEGTISSTNVITRNSRLNQLTLGSSLMWETAWDDESKSSISLYGSFYDVDAINATIESNTETTQKNVIHDRGLRLADSRRLTEIFRLNSGYQYNEISIENTEEINVPFRETLKNVLRTHALVGELEYEPDDGLLYAKAGIRANYIEQFSMLYAEPRLQLNYDISNIWRLDVLAEQKSQTASQIVEFQDDFLGIEKRRWILANDNDIPVQRSSQVSGGLTYKNRGWLVSLELFYKKVSGITTEGQAFQDKLERVSATGSYRVQGSEFLIQKQYKKFYAWLSYTWNNNNYEFKTISPYIFPSNLDINHTINTAATYELFNFKVALGSRWFTGRPVTTPVSTQAVNLSGTPEIIYAATNSDNIENFFQVNFSAVYAWKLSDATQLQFGVSVLNIFNRQNIINRYYRINADTEAIEVVNTYSLERTPNALIKLVF